MRTLILAFLIGFLATLTFLVIHNAATPNCESQYNEYMNTVNMHDREVLFQKGLDNGCFHYN